MKRILVIHGPNLNLLGKREADIYGTVSIGEIDKMLKEFADGLGYSVETEQSNYEGDIVSMIGGAKDKNYSGILINPAAFTHTSIAILDAIRAVDIPVVEVHLSNIYKREEFRHKSVTAGGVLGQVSGFGVNSYILGLKGLIDFLENNNVKG